MQSQEGSVGPSWSIQAKIRARSTLVSLPTSVTGWEPPECREGAQSPAFGILGRLYSLELKVCKGHSHDAGVVSMQDNKESIS